MGGQEPECIRPASGWQARGFLGCRNGCRRSERDLADARVSQVGAHLDRRPTCPPLYAALVGVHAGMGRTRDPDTVVPAPSRGVGETRLGLITVVTS
jgi:hypothetical protein